MENRLSIADYMDYDWLVDMHCANHQMMIKQVPDFEGNHVVLYGKGASKMVSHAAWLAYEDTKRKAYSPKPVRS